MPRELTWDAEYGLELWIAEVSVAEMSRRLLVSRRTILSFAKYHDWPTRIGYERGGQPRVRLVLPLPRAKKPKRDRALVLAKWERRRYERRQRDLIDEARRQLHALELAQQPKRGRPKKTQERAA